MTKLKIAALPQRFSRGISAVTKPFRRAMLRSNMQQQSAITSESSANCSDRHAEIDDGERRSRLREAFVDVSSRYFVGGERGSDVSISFEDAKPDSDPNFIQWMFRQNQMHEPEYAIFKFFTDRRETVIDIGANFGYSAISIWASGSKANVMSFEPNPIHAGCLAQIKADRPGKYDFMNVGIGRKVKPLKFYVPVLNGLAVSALTSLEMDRTIGFLAENNFVDHAMKYCEAGSVPTLQFAQCEWEISPLDDIMRSHRFDVPTDRISAIKIDVEGFEGPALKSGEETLRQHRPLIMIEGANRDREVSEFLRSLGYCAARFANGRCALTEELISDINGYFLHETRLEQYRKRGILVAK